MNTKGGSEEIYCLVLQLSLLNINTCSGRVLFSGLDWTLDYGTHPEWTQNRYI